MKNQVHLMVVTVFLSGCASHSSSVVAIQALPSANVLTISKPPVVSGAIATFVEIDVEHDGQAITLLYPYMEDAQKLPSRGSSCDFQYTMKKVYGQTAKQTLQGNTVKVIKTFKCSSNQSSGK